MLILRFVWQQWRHFARPMRPTGRLGPYFRWPGVSPIVAVNHTPPHGSAQSPLYDVWSGNLQLILAIDVTFFIECGLLANAGKIALWGRSSYVLRGNLLILPVQRIPPTRICRNFLYGSFRLRKN